MQIETRKTGNPPIFSSCLTVSWGYFISQQAEALQPSWQLRIPDWKVKANELHDLEVPRPNVYDTDATWDELDYTGGDDGPHAAGSEGE